MEPTHAHSAAGDQRPSRNTVILAALCIGVAWPAMAQTPPVPPPQHHRPHHARRAAAKPVPPPAATASVTPVLPGSPAPVPDESAAAPVARQAQDTQVSPSVMQLHYPNVGNGYLPGSSPQAMDDLRAAKAGGVEVTVPLQAAPRAALPSPTDPASAP